MGILKRVRHNEETIMRTVLLAVISLAILASAQESNPSLEETLQWMQQTLVQHGSYVEYYKYKTLRTRHDLARLAKYEGCHVTVNIDFHGALLEDARDTATAEFDLKDLDPSAVITEPSRSFRVAILVDGNGPYDEAFVKISTRNSALAIHRAYTIYWDPREWKSRGVKQSTPESEDVSSLEIGVDSPEYGNRLTKAFKHAAELCGGKSSAF